MIVYGDHMRRDDGRAKVAALDDWLRQASLSDAGLQRHGFLVAALLEAGELAQGLADRRFVDIGMDEPDRLDAALMALVAQLAGAVGRSWDSGFLTFGPVPTPAHLAAIGVPNASLLVRQPEGFAHYAVYPESVRAAVRTLGPQPDARVIGIRSIGTTLAAMVSDGLGARPPVTVRPSGHPFSRHLVLGPALADALAGPPDALHAIVDEGPGLSGSSFGAVADALAVRGVPERSLLFVPSHGGDPGSEASDAHRRRWQTARRAVVTFDDLTGPAARPAHRIAAWAEDLIGPTLAPPRDLGAGRWRTALLPRTHLWPPADAQNEMRKWLLTTARGTFLLRFVGLGAIGLRKFEMAQRLAAAGFGLAPIGWRHGVMVEPWRDDCLPATLDGFSRNCIASVLADYLGFRADAFPAADESGATLAALHDMARVNTAEALGNAAAAPLAAWTRLLPHLAPRMRRIAVDGRLQPWEWLEAPDGRLFKTDALDHHAAHDLVGCQPIEWDLAGAAAEWDLTEGECSHLHRHLGVGRESRSDPTLLQFFAIAYAAFQVGAATMAAGRADVAERPRWSIRLNRCKTMLKAALEATP